MNNSAATAAKSSNKARLIKGIGSLRTRALIALIISANITMPSSGEAQPTGIETFSKQLKSAYPSDLADISDGFVVFTDGTRLILDDGKGEKSFIEWLARPDIKDMFRFEYQASKNIEPPPKNFDPGRARNVEFFNKIYGSCAKGEVAKHLVEITWLPKKSGTRVKVTSQNGVAEKFRAVSAELDELPSRFDVNLRTTAGTYVCRNIAGTTSPSAHGYGIAIDIDLKNADYWRWSKGKRALPRPDRGEPIARQYRNRIPIEIVQIFEKHGFIWGGRWYHYDTMHFEYRPELLPQKSQARQ